MYNKDLIYNRKDLPLRKIAESINVSLGYVSKHVSYKGGYKVDNAIIFAAGKGSRLMPYTLNKPKPLVEVNGKPIIETTIENLMLVGIKDIYIVAGYHMESFDDLINKYPFIKIIENNKYSLYNNILSLYAVRNILSNTLIIEGDIYWNRNQFSSYYSGNTMYSYQINNITPEWIFKKSGKYITGYTKGSKNGGPAWSGTYFLTKDTSENIRIFFEKIYTDETHGHMYAEQIFWNEKYKFNDILISKKSFFEIDTVDDIQRLNKGSEGIELEDPKEVAAFYLGCNIGDISKVQPIKAGLTNNVYVFKYKNKKHIIRLPKEETNKNIDRDKEYEIIEVIKSIDVSPRKVFFSSNGVMITEFVENSEHLDPSEEKHIEKVATQLVKIHKLEITGIDVFKPKKIIENFLDIRSKNDLQIHDEIKNNFEIVKSIIKRHYRNDSKFSLCHNDLLGSNVLITKKDSYIIDWELASMNDIYFDFASLFIENEFTEEQEIKFFEAYGLEIINWNKLIDFKILLSFIWATWTYQYKEWDQSLTKYFKRKIKYLLENVKRRDKNG